MNHNDFIVKDTYLDRFNNDCEYSDDSYSDSESNYDIDDSELTFLKEGKIMFDEMNEKINKLNKSNKLDKSNKLNKTNTVQLNNKSLKTNNPTKIKLNIKDLIKSLIKEYNYNITKVQKYKQLTSNNVKYRNDIMANTHMSRNRSFPEELLSLKPDYKHINCDLINDFMKIFDIIFFDDWSISTHDFRLTIHDLNKHRDHEKYKTIKFPTRIVYNGENYLNYSLELIMLNIPTYRFITVPCGYCMRKLTNKEYHMINNYNDPIS